MNNIFDTNDLYPGYDDHLKAYFNRYFDSVFICFSPFFQIDSDSKQDRSLHHSRIVSLEELQATNDIFKKLQPSDQRVIYSSNNVKYPDTDEIIDKGKPVQWQYIKHQGQFNSYTEINLALRTSIGALRKEFERTDLQQKLDKVSDDYFIYNPTEGRINQLSLIQIYQCLKALNKVELVVTDEFFENRKTINLNTLSCPQFVNAAYRYMYYFPVDRSLLFTVEWDSFFYLIGGDRTLLDGLIAKFGFEGFYASDETYHDWDF